MKKILSFGLVLLLSFCTISTTASAYVPCSEGGKHTMRPYCVGICYSGTVSKPGKALFKGPVYKCDKCGIHILSQYDPPAARCLGQYNISYSVEYLDGVAAFFGGSHGTYWSLTEDSFIQGFEFYLS